MSGNRPISPRQAIRSISARKLRVIPLAASTYFMVSGGAYGLEELVQQSGYAVALLILLIVPLVWSLPTALMVGELSAAIPAEGGFYVWVHRALGPFWGFQEAWLSLTSSVFDMAAYPAVFVLSLGRIWPSATQGSNGIWIGALVIATCVVWNVFGARQVGRGAIWMGILLLLPFVLIATFALFRHAATAAGKHAAGHPDLLAGIMVAMWNYMGWDNASTVAGEVENPQKTYPRVMALALAAIVLSYVIPIAAVWRTGILPGDWATGSWASIATRVAGPDFGAALGVAVVLGSLIGAFGSVNALTMSYSRIPAALAEYGYAPRLLLRKLPNGVPWVSLALCGIAWTAALGLNFDRLLMLDILLYGASLILEFVALAVLRVREPKLYRPFTVQGGWAGAVLIGIGPAALLILALIKNRDERIGPVSALFFGLMIMAGGVVFYFVAAWRKKRSTRDHDAG
ncbi:MAG: APC family permease [Acidobacteriota bacterium]|nr:APC family permease [Acidobacteriota bacterium]